MTYLSFHLIFMTPALIAAGYAARGPVRADVHRIAKAIATVCAIAILYTTPWDQHLISRGIWTYDASRILGTIGHVPIEEYGFFVLQPILASLVFLALARGALPRGRPRATMSASGRSDTGRVRIAWTGFWIVVTMAGVLLLGRERATYLALILAWAGPVLAVQAYLAAAAIVRHAFPGAVAALLTTLYLSVADRFAIGNGIWHIAEGTSTGLDVFGLPIEEAVFFLVTNLLVVQGLLLFLCPADVREVLGRSAAAPGRAHAIVVSGRERP